VRRRRRGKVAERKVAGLLEAGRDGLCRQSSLTPVLAEWAAQGVLTVHLRPYEAPFWGGLPRFAATNVRSVNAQVALEAQRTVRWSMSPMRRRRGSFVTPSF